MEEKYDPDYLPRLYHGNWDVSKRWYIDFRVWDTDKKEFVRKQYTGMNKHKTLKKRKEAALAAKEQITQLIKSGAVTGEAPVEPDNPFDLKKFTVHQAFTYYLNHKNNSLANNEAKHLEKQYQEGKSRISEATYKEYKWLYSKVTEFLKKEKQENLLLAYFNAKLANKFIDYLQKESELANTTINSAKGYLSSFFNYWIKNHELEIKNPTLRIDNLPEEETEKHPPYTSEQWHAIVSLCKDKGEEQLLLFIYFIYYLFIRPRKELRLLKVKDIFLRTVLIRGTNAKNNRGQHITIPLELEQLIQAYGIRNYPPDYYVFTIEGKPGEKPTGVNYFYKKHTKILKQLGIEGHSLYGYKHTGAIQLYEQTLDILAVSRHCRHSSTTQTEEYLRGYGVISDKKVLNFKAFKIG